MYRIKQVPEDFVVKEISNIELRKKGDYSYFLLKKRDYTTQKAVEEFAKNADIRLDNISYAGTKDKHALTEQLISVWYGNPALENIALKDIQLKFLGKGYLKINTGDLIGNEFLITVRNLEDEDIISFANKLFEEEVREDFELDDVKRKMLISDVEEAFRKKRFFVPNYFDEQRFSKNNCMIGKFIISKKFEDAVELILNFDIEEKVLKENWRKWELLLGKTKSSIETNVLNHLISNKNDFIGALRTIPKKISKMYIHSFQSLIFNTTLAELIKEWFNGCIEVVYSRGMLVFPKKIFYSGAAGFSEKSGMKIPIVGFGTELEELKAKDAKVHDVINRMLEKEGISTRDFVIANMPELTSEGDLRNAFTEIKDFKIKEFGEDELNKEKYKFVLSFTLEKASYATIVIKNLFA